MKLYQAEFDNGLIVMIRSREKLEDVRVPYPEGLRSICFKKDL